MSAIVISKDLRPFFGEARNQGSRPTCLAFAASDAHAALRPGWAPLSAEFAFYQAQRRAGRSPASGALLSSMLEALRLDGQPEEGAWPYLAVTPVEVTSWLPPNVVGQIYRRASETARATLTNVLEQLDSGNPAILLLMLSAAFYLPAKNGVVRAGLGEAPEPARRHAVIAIAHGTVDGERAVLVRNSWGSSWGLAGYAWLLESFLAPRLYSVAALMEDIDVPAGPASA